MNGCYTRRARRARALLFFALVLASTLLGWQWLPVLDWAEAVEGINILFGIQAAPVRKADAPSLLNDSDIRAGSGVDCAGTAGAALRVQPSAARDSR